MGWRRDAREKTGRLFKRVIKKYLKNAEKLVNGQKNIGY